MKADEVYAKLKKMIASVSVGIKSTTSTKNPDGSVTITINFTSGSPLSFTMSPVKGDKGTGIKDALIKEIQNGENTEYHLILIDDKNNNIDAGKLPISPGEVYDDTQIKSDINDLKSDKQDKTDNSLETTDKTLVGAINTINGNQLDTVTFSADYKNIILNRKNGLNPYIIPIASIINNAKIAELNDVDSTNIGDGKTLVYDSSIKKHKYVDSTLTDELVKMDSTTDAKHLSELIDKSTIVNDNGVLKVKKLDGQNVTIAEINHLKGLTMNVMDLVNMFANGGVKVYEHTIPTYADLLALDRSGFIDGIKYFVYVQSDEEHGGAKTTYICDKSSTSYFCVSGDHRDFTINPIDLANEVTGKLGTSNIDVDELWKLLTINDTYKTLTTKDEVFGTHGAKALYDELVADIGKKANATDLTTHTSDTNIHITSAERTAWNKKANATDLTTHTGDTNIHVTTSDKTKWNKVDNKVDKTDITTTINSSSTASQVPSAKSVYDKVIKCNNIKTYYTLAQLGIDSTKTCTIKYIWDKMPVNSIGVIDTNSSIVTDLDYFKPALKIADGQNVYGFLTIGKFIERTILEFRRAHSESAIIPETFIGYCIGKNCTSIDWKRIIIANIDNVPMTTITSFDDETKYTVADGNVCRYYVTNGECEITLYIKAVSPSNPTHVKVFSGLPKAVTSRYFTLGSWGEATSDNVIAEITSNGILNLKKGTINGLYIGSFKYKVAENQ